MRKLPVYFVVDSPISMSGKPMNEIVSLIKNFMKFHKGNPMAIECLHISIISSNDLHSVINQSLISLIEFEENIQIECKGKSDIFNGIELVKKSVETEEQTTTNSIRGIYKPILFLFVGTIPQQEFPKHLLNFINSKMDHCGDFFDPFGIGARSIATIGTPRENPSVIYYQNEYVAKYYRKYFNNVIELKSLKTSLQI